MNATVATEKFKGLLRDILDNTTIKLGKVLVKFIINCVIAIVSVKGRVNFLQLMRHSHLNEKTFRNNFSKEVDWVGLNSGIALRELPEASHRVVVIDPAHIDKSGKSTPGIGKYWSGVAGQAKRGLEITAMAAVDYTTRRTVMLGAEQTLPGQGGDTLSMTDCYIQAIRKYKDELLQISKIMAADAYFARKPFTDAVTDMGFTLVSRFPSNYDLRYLATEEWLAERGVKRGRTPIYAGRVDTSKPDPRFLEQVSIKSAKEAWTGIVYSNALERNVRVVIVTWEKTGVVTYFSTDTAMHAEVIVSIYQSRFQVEFGIRDGRQFTGLHHSQARSEAKLDFAFNVSFFTRNVLQTEIDRYYPQNSVGQLKKTIADTEFALRILNYAFPEGVEEKILDKVNHMIASYVGAVA